MKNLSLFVTLGLISLMGAFAPVNAEPEDMGADGAPTEAQMAPDDYVESDSEKVILQDDPSISDTQVPDNLSSDDSTGEPAPDLTEEPASAPSGEQ